MRRVFLKSVVSCLFVAMLVGCQLNLSVDEGGELVSVSGDYNCSEDSCSLEIPLEGFDETFIAVPNEGYLFMGWEKQCPGERVSSCRVVISPPFSATNGVVEMIARFAPVADTDSLVSLAAETYIEVPRFAIPSGTVFSAKQTRKPLVAEGITLIGDAFEVTSSSDLQQAATIYWPLPEGIENTENLRLLRIEADGTTTVLMTSIEGEFLVADTPGFSTVALGSLVGSRAWLVAEINGFESLSYGQKGKYQVNFIDVDGPNYSRVDGIRATWRLFGIGELLESENGSYVTKKTASTADILMEGPSVTRGDDIQLHAQFVYKGHRYNISKRVKYSADNAAFAVEAASINDNVRVDKDRYEPFIAMARVSGAMPPISWLWDFGDGDTGSQQTSETMISLPAKRYTLADLDQYRSVNITASDAGGNIQTAKIGVAVRPYDLQVSIDGPDTLEIDSWADPGVVGDFSPLIDGGNSPFTYDWTLDPGGFKGNSNFSEQDFFFEQPGEHRLSLTVTDFQGSKAEASLLITVQNGEPLGVSISELPETAEELETVTGRFGIRGGVLVASGIKGGYEFQLDWGDNTETLIEKDVLLTGLPHDGLLLSESHRYTEAGRYTVKATLFDSTGHAAEQRWNITVAAPVADDTGAGEAVLEELCPASLEMIYNERSSITVFDFYEYERLVLTDKEESVAYCRYRSTETSAVKIRLDIGFRSYDGDCGETDSDGDGLITSAGYYVGSVERTIDINIANCFRCQDHEPGRAVIEQLAKDLVKAGIGEACE